MIVNLAFRPPPGFLGSAAKHDGGGLAYLDPTWRESGRAAFLVRPAEGSRERAGAVYPGLWESASLEGACG